MIDLMFWVFIGFGGLLFTSRLNQTYSKNVNLCLLTDIQLINNGKVVLKSWNFSLFLKAISRI